MRFLDLFSGIGGFALGLEKAGMTVAAFCEIDPFCQQVLRKHWPHVPIFSDICELTKEKLIETGVIDVEAGRTIDFVCGGFP
jgi:DNA (cytosine-5)-methyltransferase 1